jgi:hypothetical protein
MDNIRLTISECNRILEFAETVQTKKLYDALTELVRHNLISASSELHRLSSFDSMPVPLSPVRIPDEEYMPNIFRCISSPEHSYLEKSKTST